KFKPLLSSVFTSDTKSDFDRLLAGYITLTPFSLAHRLGSSILGSTTTIYESGSARDSGNESDKDFINSKKYVIRNDFPEPVFPETAIELILSYEILKSCMSGIAFL